MSNIKTIYIQLLEEGTPTARPTLAEEQSDGTYKVMQPESGYDPEDEIWEFRPGTTVRCKMTPSVFGDEMLLAYEEVK